MICLTSSPALSDAATAIAKVCMNGLVFVDAVEAAIVVVTSENRVFLLSIRKIETRVV